MSSFPFHVTVGPNPATGLVSGQTCNLYLASRFTSAPVTNTAAPGGGADYGPLSTDTVVDFNLGGLETTTTTFDNFYVSYYDPLDTTNAGSWNLYWLGPILPQSPTNVQGWTASASYPSRTLPSTTIPGGGGLPMSTITVVSTAGFAASGMLIILANGLTPVVITYLGKTVGPDTFTGCTGGSGALTPGDPVFQGYTAGPTRRHVVLTAQSKVLANGDAATIAPYTTTAGVLTVVGTVGISNWTAATTLATNYQVSVSVDPNAVYGFRPAVNGTGTVVLTRWTEEDY